MQIFLFSFWYVLTSSFASSSLFLSMHFLFISFRSFLTSSLPSSSLSLVLYCFCLTLWFSKVLLFCIHCTVFWIIQCQLALYTTPQFCTVWVALTKYQHFHLCEFEIQCHQIRNEGLNLWSSSLYGGFHFHTSMNCTARILWTILHEGGSNLGRLYCPNILNLLLQDFIFYFALNLNKHTI